MRLIDADAMKRNYPIMENDFGMVINKRLHKGLDNQPTVKAIPIEKLEQILSEISEEIGTKQWEDYDYCSGLIRAKNIINKAIKEVEQNDEHNKT